MEDQLESVRYPDLSTWDEDLTQCFTPASMKTKDLQGHITREDIRQNVIEKDIDE